MYLIFQIHYIFGNSYVYFRDIWGYKYIKCTYGIFLCAYISPHWVVSERNGEVTQKEYVYINFICVWFWMVSGIISKFALKKMDNVLVISNFLLSLYQSNRMSVSEWVCVFVCSLTPTKRWILMSWNFEGWFPWDGEGFRLKKHRPPYTNSLKNVKRFW